MRRVAMVAALAWCLGAATATTVYEVYRVQSSDTVETIAARFGMKPDELRDLNPFLRTGTLTVNELITVMTRTGRPAVAAATTPGSEGGSFAGANGAGSLRGGAPRLVDVDEQTAPLAGPTAPAAEQPAVVPQAEPARQAVQKSFAVNGAVGRLGVVVSDRTPIFRERGTGRVLFTCQKGARLAVTKQLDRWLAVMMVDGSTGWVESQFVNLTTTELVQGQASPQATRGSGALQEAYRYLGVPYRWGGESMSGVDCSGLVLQCYRKQGQRLPRTAREQFLVGQPVRWDQLQAGDRLYFASDGRRIDHTGMYIGGGQFIHASGRKRMVTVDNLFDSRYWSIYVGAKR